MIINLDFNSEIPIYTQLRNQIVIGIGKGELSQGENLPSVRQMSVDLRINPMTVNKAYGILKSEGFIAIDRRHGAIINTVRKLDKEKLEQNLTLLIYESGANKEEILDICNKIFNTIKGDDDICLQ